MAGRFVGTFGNQLRRPHQFQVVLEHVESIHIALIANLVLIIRHGDVYDIQRHFEQQYFSTAQRLARFGKGPNFIDHTRGIDISVPRRTILCAKFNFESMRQGGIQNRLQKLSVIEDI